MNVAVPISLFTCSFAMLGPWRLWPLAKIIGRDRLNEARGNEPPAAMRYHGLPYETGSTRLIRSRHDDISVATTLPGDIGRNGVLRDRLGTGAGNGLQQDRDTYREDRTEPLSAVRFGRGRSGPPGRCGRP